MSKNILARLAAITAAATVFLTPGRSQAQLSHDGEAAVARLVAFLGKHGDITSESDGVRVTVRTRAVNKGQCTIEIVQDAHAKTGGGDEVHYGTKETVRLSTMSPTAKKIDPGVPGEEMTVLFTTTAGDSSVIVTSFVEGEIPDIGSDHEAVIEFPKKTDSDSAIRAINDAITKCGGKPASPEIQAQIEERDREGLGEVKTLYGLDLNPGDSIAVVETCRDKIRMRFDPKAILDFDKTKPLIMHNAETGQFAVVGSVSRRDGKADIPYACTLEQRNGKFVSVADRIVEKH